MKVRELIEILSRENQDHEVQFVVDQDITGNRGCGWLRAETISNEGFRKFYEYDDSYMNESDVDEAIRYNSAIEDEELTEIEIDEIIGRLDSIEGVFIRLSA